MNLGLVKSFIAGGTINPNTFVKFSADNTVVAAAAATDVIIGVCVTPNGVTSGQRVDVQLTGVAEVKMGGTVARGTPVTSDANGKGVAPAPAAGVNNYVAGRAMVTSADGDLIDVLLAPSTINGAGVE